MAKKRYSPDDVPVSESGQMLKNAMEVHGFMPKPKRDQHFMVDDSVILKAATAHGLPPGSKVIEIGPGCGQLTKPLLDAGYRVTALEVDERLAPVLEEIKHPRLNLRFEDAIAAKWPEADAVISNLPFSISEPFLYKLAVHHEAEYLTLILGYKLAHKLRETSGVSKLKLLLKGFFQITSQEMVPREAFFPTPPQPCLLLVATRRPLGSGNLHERFWQQFFSAEDTSIGVAIRNSLPPLKRGRHLSVSDLGISQRELSWPMNRVTNQHLAAIDQGLRKAFVKSKRQDPHFNDIRFR